MNDKMNIFDVEIDVFTAKTAMKAAVQYMQSESINTIEIVTLDMLAQGLDDPEWKENTKFIDMILPGDREILESAGIQDRVLLKDARNRMFLRMFLQFLQKNRRKVFLFVESEEELCRVKTAMKTYNKGILISGYAVLNETGNSEDNIINDINGAEIDCILSTLSSPAQEKFIVKNSALLNSRVWLGCGKALEQNYSENIGGAVYRFLIKKMFRYRLGKQKRENE